MPQRNIVLETSYLWHYTIFNNSFKRVFRNNSMCDLLMASLISYTPSWPSLHSIPPLMSEISHTSSCPFSHSIPPVMSEHKILFQNTAILPDEMQNTKAGFIHHPTDDTCGWPRNAFILLSVICTASMGSSQLAEHSMYLEIPYVEAIYTSTPNYMLVVLPFRLQVSSRCCFTPFVQSIRFSCKFSTRHFKKTY